MYNMSVLNFWKWGKLYWSGIFKSLGSPGLAETVHWQMCNLLSFGGIHLTVTKD